MKIEGRSAAMYSPLTLAYLGDAVYELYVRENLVLRANESNGKLHAEALQYVSAKGQCAFFKKIEAELTPEELIIYKRGRNSDAVPGRNNDIADYKRATGVETLFGYLYLSGNTDRMEYLFSLLEI